MLPAVTLSPAPGRATRGTVSLVALCFVAVLGISLAGYIAVCTRAMTLSNRSFQANLGQQLAELGIEEALRAFNKNLLSGTDTTAALADWSSGGVTVNWSLDTTNKRATATMSFSAGKFAQGTTASVKIRVDNYDSAQLGNTWNSTTNYRVNDIVNRSGIWYRCVQANSNSTPNGLVNLANWVPDFIPTTWISTTVYSLGDIVVYGSVWYRYVNASSSSAIVPGTNAAYWRSCGTSYNGGSWYNAGDVIFYSPWNAWIISGSSGWGGGSWGYASAAWRWTGATTYEFNDVVLDTSTGTWYRYINSTATSGNALSSTAYWEVILTGAMNAWNATSINYSVGDVVYNTSNSRWYRCIKAHTSSSSITPTSAEYWNGAPFFSNVWDSGKRYSQNDTVYYNGVWYLSLLNSNIGQNPATATTYWIGANTTSSTYVWNSSTNYALGAYCCYGGVWYKCSTANTNKSPNNTGFWTNTWANSFNITTGAPVAYAEATISIGGSPAVKTQLRARLSPAPLFPNAAGATTDLTITTGNGTVDSYDASVAAYAAASAGYSAVLAAGTTLAINGTTDVKGYLAWPSPPSGISTGTTVKSATSPASPNVDKSRVSRSPYIPKYDTLPYTGLVTAWATVPKGTQISSPTVSNQTLNLGTPGAITPSIYYFNGDLELEQNVANSYRTIQVNGPVKLYIKGYLRLRGGSNFYINAPGMVEIHVGTYLYLEAGAFTNRAPNATNPDPQNLVVICDTASNSTQTYVHSPSSFHGVIYMPNTTATVGLNIASGIQIYGALSAREITFGSEANLHYDTSLRYATIPGVDQPYAVTEWRELPATEQATMP